MSAARDKLHSSNSSGGGGAFIYLWSPYNRARLPQKPIARAQHFLVFCQNSGSVVKLVWGEKKEALRLVRHHISHS